MYPYDNNDERQNNGFAPAAEPETPTTPDSQPESAAPPLEPAVDPSPSAFEPFTPTEEPAPVVPPQEEPAVPTYTGEVSGWHQPEVNTPPTPPVTPSYPSSYQYTTGRAYDPYGWQQQQPTPPAPQPPKKKRSGSSVVLAILACVCVVTIVVLSVMMVFAIQQNPDLLTDLPSSSGTTNDNAADKGNTDVPSIDITETEEDADALTTQAIIQKNLNCTVVITTYEQNTYYNNFQFGGSYSDNQDAGLTEASSATGIIMSEDGYIITNRHCVINESTNIQYAQINVKTYDGTVYEKAEVIGVDSDTDLAVIKVKASGLTEAEFGDSSQLKLGDKVVALGNSGGLEWTPTQGIISGLARDVYDDTGYSIKCLQTDAAINPGNSGGPLINAQGQVIGINSAKIVASGYESLGFSIPINEAKSILESLLQYGYVKGRVSLGITGSTYTSTNSNYDGFQIMTINTDSSLAGTEAQAGDIITHVNDVRVTDYATLRAQLSTHNVGDTVTLTLLHVNSYNRQVETITVTCTLQESTGD